MNLSASLSMAANQDCDILGGISIMKQNGFSCQDFNSCTYCGERAIPGTTALTRDDWLCWIDSIGEQAARQGVVLTQCHGPIYNYYSEDEVTAIHHTSTKRVLQACNRLGISNVVFHPEVPPGKRAIQDIDACRKANVKFLSDVAEEASKWDVMLCIENMFNTKNKDGSLFWRYCSNPDELIDLVDSINMENVTICMDVGHAHIMEETIDSSISKYGKRLQALHIHDNDGHSDQHLTPYLGKINWQEVIDGLQRIGYTGDFTLEVPNAAIRMPMELRAVGIRAASAVGMHLLNRFQTR